MPFGFVGGLYDADTGLTQFGAREYAPEVGRWTAKDPSLFEGGGNFYVYAEGAPVYKLDLNGRAATTFDGYCMRRPSECAIVVGAGAAALTPAGQGATADVLGAGVRVATDCGEGFVGIADLMFAILFAEMSPFVWNPPFRAKRQYDRIPRRDPDDPRWECIPVNAACRVGCEGLMGNPIQGPFPFYRCVNTCLEAAGCPPGMY